jgi:hypothetical protein
VMLRNCLECEVAGNGSGVNFDSLTAASQNVDYVTSFSSQREVGQNVESSDL